MMLCQLRSMKKNQSMRLLNLPYAKMILKFENVTDLGQSIECCFRQVTQEKPTNWG